MKKGIVVLVLAAAVLMKAVIYPDASEKSAAKDNHENTVVLEAEKKTEEVSEKAASEDKSETVYVSADAGGNVKSISVEEILSVTKEAETISDFSLLTNIRNTQSDEELLENKDGELIWENHGENIHYKGETEEELPFSLKISYFLDEKLISPEELAGKSGTVRIVFQMDNHTSETVNLNGKKYTLPIPFSAFSIVVLNDSFSNIEVEGGRLIEMDSGNLAVGMMFPGLAEALILEKNEVTKNIELRDSFEITAEVENFSLSFTETIVTAGLLSEIDEADLKDLKNSLGDISKLSEASKELGDGIESLSEGAEELKTALKEYTGAISQAAQGFGSLNDGMQAMDENLPMLDEGAAGLSAGISGLSALFENEQLLALQGMAFSAVCQLKEDLEALAEEYAYFETLKTELLAVKTVLDDLALDALEENVQRQIDDKLNELGIELDEDVRQELLNAVDLTDISSQKEAALNQINSALALFEEDRLTEAESSLSSIEKQLEILGQYQAAFGQIDGLSENIEQLAAGSLALSQGISQLRSGIHAAAEGTAALKDGMDALSEAGQSINEGLTAFCDGTSQLYEGFKTFDEEGIQKLANTLGTQMLSLVNKIEALRQLGENYISFGGIKEGKSGSTRFIIETEAIKK